MGHLYAALCLSFVARALAVSITDIQGPAFLSPLSGQTVTDVQGIVTAKGPSGFWITGPASSDPRESNGISVFTSSKTILAQVSVGDLITLGGKVAEFHSNANVLSVTEIGSPTNITVLSSNNTVEPVLLGKDKAPPAAASAGVNTESKKKARKNPPTQSFSALDAGDAGIFSVPNNSSRLETVNATLQPDAFGIDFWESLEGQLVTIPNPVALNFENSFGEFWVRGDWPVTGKNKQGGLTISSAEGGVPDSNPETIIIGTPLDGSRNPSVAIGTTLASITGVVQYQFGFYYVVPLVAPTVLNRLNSTVPPTKLTTSKNTCIVTLGDYNIENFAPNDTAHVTQIATHIAQYLKTPDLIFVQEVQDSSGPKNDGTVSANITLQTLVDAIKTASGGVEYAFVGVDPVDGKDGGEPGGNIRQVYLYRPEIIIPAGGSPVGGSLDATAVQVGADGRLGLTFNPGRIQPEDSAWLNSRKSLAAVWERVGGHGERLFTINVHHTSKGGSTSEQGNIRPPVNAGVDHRAAQVALVADFTKSILAHDVNASVVAAGDFNEFVQTTSVYAPFEGILSEIDNVAGIHPMERYTYVFDMNMEQLDHIFISNAVAGRKTQVEHIHVNQWAPNNAARASDHDPSVARVRIC